MHLKGTFHHFYDAFIFWHGHTSFILPSLNLQKTALQCYVLGTGPSYRLSSKSQDVLPECIPMSRGGGGGGGGGSMQELWRGKSMVTHPFER